MSDSLVETSDPECTQVQFAPAVNEEFRDSLSNRGRMFEPMPGARGYNHHVGMLRMTVDEESEVWKGCVQAHDGIHAFVA